MSDESRAQAPIQPWEIRDYISQFQDNQLALLEALRALKPAPVECEECKRWYDKLQASDEHYAGIIKGQQNDNKALAVENKRLYHQVSQLREDDKRLSAARRELSEEVARLKQEREGWELESQHKQTELERLRAAAQEDSVIVLTLRGELAVAKSECDRLRARNEELSTAMFPTAVAAYRLKRFSDREEKVRALLEQWSHEVTFNQDLADRYSVLDQAVAAVRDFKIDMT